MNRKILFMALIAFLGTIGLALVIGDNSSHEPLIIRESGTYRKLSIDEKIREAEIIIIGELKTVLPSRWDSDDGKGPQVVTPQSIFEADLSIFTDSLLLVNELLKGEVDDQGIIRVRSFSGEADNVRWVDNSQPAFEHGQTYLLFLKKNTGPTRNLDAGAYMSINGISAIYSVSEDIAKSVDDTWALSDLVDYIRNSISSETPSPTEASADLQTETPTLTETPTETSTIPAETPTP